MIARRALPGVRPAPLSPAVLMTLLLSGCVTAPDQRLADGQAGCVTISSVYGSVSQVVSRADNVPKGSSAGGKTRITCGSAVMEIENTVTGTPAASGVKP